MNWKLPDAKDRFSELVTKAITEGPQRVERRNDVGYVLSEADYLRLQGKQTNAIEFLLAGGPDLSELDLGRDPSPMREIDL